MNKWIELLLGLILVIVPIYVAWSMKLYGLGSAAIVVLKGGIIWAIIGIGLLLILLGISDLKE
ncbi:hypothetical protein HYW76_01220 [Candidatus Pacearchaeota archaeon]|nr:hypothetical protein [Candidatus Pacearchaeota archaeon]